MWITNPGAATLFALLSVSWICRCVCWISVAGTGKFLKQFRKNDYLADGCDSSSEMIKIAKQINPNAQIWQDAMPELTHTPPQHYSIITCLYDSMNYLQNAESFATALKRIYELLPPGGIFVFDVVSELCCKTYFDDLHEIDEVDDKYSFERFSHYDSANKQQITEFHIRTPEGIFRETHCQQIYTFREIRDLIKENTAFEICGMFEEFSFYTAEESSNRAHFILKRPVND